MDIWVIGLGSGCLAVAVVVLGLPGLLRSMGLHRELKLPARDLRGRRALIITTSCSVLGDTGKTTGVFASEMTAPYYTFTDAGLHVDIASIAGGAIPIEPASLRWPIRSRHDARFQHDKDFLAKTRASLAIGQVDPSRYDIVFLAGGWGAAYDFAQSPQLGAFLAGADKVGVVLGGVCHGPLGLLAAGDGSGAPLVKGRRLTAVTDKQIRELGITATPRHPERDLTAAGALFESRHGLRDIFASHVVVDGRLVTGQNQNDGAETADRMMHIIAQAPSAPPA